MHPARYDASQVMSRQISREFVLQAGAGVGLSCSLSPENAFMGSLVGSEVLANAVPLIP